jgi:MFS family permease
MESVIDAPDKSASAASGVSWRRNAHAISAGNLLTNLGWSAAFAFLPLVVREMGVADQSLELWTGLIACGYFGVSCTFTPVWGVLADHYGKKSMVLRAGMGMGVGFIIISFVNQPLHFLLLMMVVGLANGYVPAGQALIATNTPREHSGGALAYTQAGAWVGNMLGPVMGAALITLLPVYRNLFVMAGITSLLAGVLALIVVREIHTRPAHKLRIDLRADIKRLWVVPELKLLYYTALVFSMTVFGANAVVSLFTLRLMEGMQTFLGYGEEAWIAITALGFTVASVAALPVWGRLLNRHDARRVLRAQLYGAFACSLLLPLVRDPLELTVTRVLFAVFMSGVLPTLVRMIRDRAPKGMEGRTLSYQTSIQQTGNAIGPLTAGLMAPYLGLRAYFVLTGVMLLVALVLWVRRERRPG